MDYNHFDNNAVYFIDARECARINEKEVIKKVLGELADITKAVFKLNEARNCLLKVHIGDPLNDTFMLPEILKPLGESLKNDKLDTVVLGDTTVAYSGKRGYKENPEDDISSYMGLAKDHGFDFFPFVILDRPVSSVKGFSFDSVHNEMDVDDDRIRYKKIYASGGFLASDAIVNNAHLTGHLIAKNAMCVKSIAMGLGSYNAKIQLHQNLYPEINHQNCIKCQKCVQACPVSALSFNDRVALDDKVCIGCGQCASVCPVKCIDMVSEGIKTWEKGTDNLDIRMAEYAVALLKNYNKPMLHVGHLYNITGMCDCMNVKQKTNCRDIGLVIGKNPFAVDFAGCTLEALMKAGDDKSYSLDAMKNIASKSSRYEVYEYMKQTFNIDYVPKLERIKI